MSMYTAQAATDTDATGALAFCQSQKTVPDDCEVTTQRGIRTGTAGRGCLSSDVDSKVAVQINSKQYGTVQCKHAAAS